ncbi:SRPBCC family protein [Streptomyces sp. NK15101]|uniref:SRPBCC family protein n=1 Tax=Streptomyces sp. NK15101 TaxID=2873261 RepID=UPI001CEC6955|nr:SRPBCC family protein [Streptomyces sp. NK15101]
MATDRERSAPNSSSPMDQLFEEVGDYLRAQADRLADKAVDKVGNLTDQLSEVAENGGSLAGIGGRLLQGDSPLKAVAGNTLDSVKDKVKDIGGGLLGKKGGRSRKSGSKPTHICESIDIGVPLRTAYDQWTQYEDFSTFAKGVRSVSQGDDTTSDWKVKVGPSTRSWKASVQEQVPDERIMWSSDGPKGTTRGCVSFHELAPALTRVLVIVEYYPSGLFEKTGNIWRAQGRRLRLDLKHFARHVTLSQEEPDGWRGEIRDGEVVRSHEEVVEEEESSQDQDQDEEPSQDEEEESSQDQPEEYEDEEYDEEEGGEEEGNDGEDEGEYAYEDEDEEGEYQGEEEDDGDWEEEEGEEEEAGAGSRARR